MIYFITNKQHKVTEDEEITIQSCLTQEDIEFLKGLEVIGFDLETNSLDPYIGSILLMIIGNEERQYVIDVTNDTLPIDYKNIDESLGGAIYKIANYKNHVEKIVLGANLKFDYKFVKVKYGVTFTRMFDVMIAEQRLVQGLIFLNGFKKTAFSSALDAIVERRLGFIPNAMDKEIRKEFINVNPNTFIFDNRHIKYAGGDIKYLFKVREKQKEKIKERAMEFLIYGIEFPLIRRLADAELHGIDIDRDKWLSNVIYNKEKQYEFQLKLDEEFKKLRDNIVSPNDKKFVSGGKWDRFRNKLQEFKQDNLFGDLFAEIETSTVKSKAKNKKKLEAYVNYSSTDTLVYIFGMLRQPLPTKQKVNVVPTFIDKRLQNGQLRKKVDKSTWSFTTGKGAIESYLTENPNTPIENFVKLLIQYRGYTVRLSTFGEVFLEKFKNRVTGKYHTQYRQCHAVNGRLQSGDEGNGWFNSQNIPAEKNYREAFVARPGYKICTTDLSGAEAVIMIDKAKDEKFYQSAILNDDAHSPLATAVWRNIGKYRVVNNLTTKQRFKDKDTDTHFYKNPFELSTIVISKKENKPIRTIFKNYTFASIYGCKRKKAAKMLDIMEIEADIALNTVKREIPKTFKLVENNAKFAQQNGFIIFNTRTNSRLWYPQIIEAKKNQSEVEWSINAEVDGSARNAPISGTQADMIKEAMVEIGNDIEKNGWDVNLIFQVHDELVYEFKEDLVDFPEYQKNKMVEVANRYLSFIKIGAEQIVGNTWTK